MSAARRASLCSSVASRMAAALNSQSEAARVMSVNTIATSPSGARTPPAATCAAEKFLEALDDDDEPVDVAEPLVEGRDHEP